MLGISKATLYAYVSRGLIEAEADRADPRRRLYRVSDVARLKGNKAVGRKRETIAAQALDWGTGALPSRITLVDRNRLFYRGQDAGELAGSASLEDVARLLWDCRDEDPFVDQPDPGADSLSKKLQLILRRRPALDRCRALLPIIVPDRHALPNREPKRLKVEAAILLRVVAALMLARARISRPIHRDIAHAWKLDRTGSDLVRSALVLLADHELNASTFAARVVASTGATPGW
jgi:citrate synthase